MEQHDYYKILGVAKDASAQEIKRAFRKRARAFHPDVNKDKGAEAQFKKLNEAYGVLKDPEKRTRYDTYGSNWQRAEEPSGPFSNQEFRGDPEGRPHARTFRFSRDGSSGENGGFRDFFDDLFTDGARPEHSRYGFGGYDGSGGTLEAEITISLQDAVTGATKSFSFHTGSPHPGNRGAAEIRNLQVKIPRGVTEGSVIRLAGQGGPGRGSGPAGDLLVRIHIAADPRFTVAGHDLHTVVSISPWEAALGAKIPVQTIDGTVWLRVPPSTQSGRRLRLRGKGLPKAKERAGDLIVDLQIQVPPRLSEDEERLFRELQNTSTFNPRAKTAQRAAAKVD